MSQPASPEMDEIPGDAPLRVMALHALAYCERLFYLEEVEEIRVADAAVWAGRRLHAELAEDETTTELVVESSRLGLVGKVDAVRRRDGSVYPLEHKRGRARRVAGARPEAWNTDELQVSAYGMLLEETLGVHVSEGRIRYHADAVTVRVPLDDEARSEVLRAIGRARALRAEVARPPVHEDEQRCARCSLAPVCLPEETRFAEREDEARFAEREDEATEATGPQERKAVAPPVRLFPPDLERRSLHLTRNDARIGKSGEAFTVSDRDGGFERFGAREVSDIVIHGHGQITTQALRSCAENDIPVHWLTASGAYVGYFAGDRAAVQRKVRQYGALSDEERCVELGRRLLFAKVENQLRLVLRGTRKATEFRAAVAEPVNTLRQALRSLARASTREELMGAEGLGARGYFAAMRSLVISEHDTLKPAGRSRRPPTDRFNALLSFGYGLLHRDVTSAILQVGLEPSFGVLHRPRSAAFPLVLDVVELFRVPVVDMAVLAAVNRKTFDPERDFRVTGLQVWLSEEGRRRMIELYERRKHEEYEHPVVRYSLSYARMMELEVRLLEKAWSGEPEVFARFRIR